MAESLRAKLAASLKAGRDLSDDITKPVTKADASALCDFLAEQTDIRPLVDASSHGEYSTQLYRLVMAFQDPEDKAAADVFRARGLPELARLCDLAMSEQVANGHALTMIAKMFALYRYEPGAGHIARIARRCTDEYFL